MSTDDVGIQKKSKNLELAPLARPQLRGDSHGRKENPTVTAITDTLKAKDAIEASAAWSNNAYEGTDVSRNVRRADIRKKIEEPVSPHDGCPQL